MNKFVKITLVSLIAAGVACSPADKGQVPQISQSGRVVVLQNEWIHFAFDLARGTYLILDKKSGEVAVSNAGLKINEWGSDERDVRRTWAQRTVQDELGKGLALDLSFDADNRPNLFFTFILYENRGLISAEAGIENTTDKPVRLKEIHVIADGLIYDKVDMTENFAMVDGFSGGEPLEYGRRLYSPLTRNNALKSRNNILLTFSKNGQRHSLVMGGLTYHDFEKYAYIEQPRRIELQKGRDKKNSLLCYLDLPAERIDKSPGGEILSMIKGEELRLWHYHEFRCKEMATSVVAPDQIVFEVRNLKNDKPYRLGFSWWNGFWHGDHADQIQSVFVEFVQGGTIKKIPLLENQLLPRFDSKKKQDVEQVELLLPEMAIRAGKLRVIFEKAARAGKETPANDEEIDDNVYLSEIWLRDGEAEALLPAELTPVSDCPRPRYHYTGQLFAMDPVGKRIDPAGSYHSSDRFYIDVSTPDPFIALEKYGFCVRTAQKINLSMYDFPTVCLWYAENSYYGNSRAENTSLGAVREMQTIAASGFLKYSRAAVRLVPDSYMPDNQQGWWDDEHWQREVIPHNDSKNGRYVPPYETSEKWAQAVTDLGGIPLTYFQTSFRSEDYAENFPDHMLFNKRYAWKGQAEDTTGGLLTNWKKTWARNKRLWGYDYTDAHFLSHMNKVFKNLKTAGVKGLMFDYPASGWAFDGGMEDESVTTAAAYRTIFRLANDGLGPGAYVHERNMERGSDISIGLVASMRTENDTDIMDGSTVTRCGLRWYKNRVLINLDTDSKNIVRLQGNRDQVRAVLTMAYVTTGRLLLANSFSQFSAETLRDLTRTFPYHTTPKSARPVDAFIADFPSVYDFEVEGDWHQLTFYNPDADSSRVVGIKMSGKPVEGALGLNDEQSYYVYDFWNDRFIGKVKGNARLEQLLRPGEARMMSVRACLDRPQVVSTDRHIMQGYLDMAHVEWNDSLGVLNGVSDVVAADPYNIIIATNGYVPLGNICKDRATRTSMSLLKEGLLRLTLDSPENGSKAWSVFFDRQ